MPLTAPADLAGQRRRHGYDLPHEHTVYIAASHGASTTSPGAEQRRHEQAEREALRSVQWGRPCAGPDDLDAAADAIRTRRRLAECRAMGCEGWPGAMPAELGDDDDRQVLGLPTTDYGTLPGDAEGYPLREPSEAVMRRRGWIVAGLVALAALLVAGLAGVWVA